MGPQRSSPTPGASTMRMAQNRSSRIRGRRRRASGLSRRLRERKRDDDCQVDDELTACIDGIIWYVCEGDSGCGLYSYCQYYDRLSSHIHIQMPKLNSSP